MHTICHIELVTTDLAQSAGIYSQLFGWKIAPMMENYWMIDLGPDAHGISGGLVRVEKIVDNGGQNYIEVRDIPATLAQAASLGAKTLEEKRPLPENMGFMAMFEMPDGFKVGLHSKE